MNRARLATQKQQTPIRSRSCSPKRISSSKHNTPLKEDLFRQILKKTAAARSDSPSQLTGSDQTTDIQLVAEVGTSLLEYCNDLKDQLGERISEASRLNSTILELEDKLQQSNIIISRSSQAQSNMQNRVWGLEVLNQENLEKMTQMDENNGKMSVEVRLLKDQNRKLQDTIEGFKLVEQRLMEKQADFISEHEAELIGLRKLISELKRDKLDLTKIVDEYQSKLLTTKVKRSNGNFSPSDSASNGGTRSSSESQAHENEIRELQEKLSAYQSEIARLQGSMELYQSDRQEMERLLADSQETIEVLKEERESIMWKMGLSSNSPIVSRSRNPSNSCSKLQGKSKINDYYSPS